MTSHAFTLAKFYKDMGDVDPDFRQTGLWDLSRELEKNGGKMTLSESDQEKIVGIIIKSLNEKESHSDVHANAIQALVHLTPKIKEILRFPLIKDLARCIHGDVKAPDPMFPLQSARIASLRDNAGIALKNIIEASDEELETKTGEEILKAIFVGFDKITDTKTKSELLDVASCVIKQFGANIKHEQYASAFTAAHTTIDARDWGLRRRALLVVAQLSLYVPQEDFNKLLDDVISGLKKKGDVFRNRAQLASAISQRAGSRFAAKVTEVVDLLSKGIENLEDDDSPESDDIRENILHAYEHITVQCAGSITTSLLNQVTSDAVRLLDWDPNFASEDFDDEDNMPLSQDAAEVYDGMACREGTVTSFDEVIDESDDSSWKVRRAAAHSLAQIIRARPDAVTEDGLFVKLFKVGNPVFLTRLRDRVESVQQEVSGFLQGIFDVVVSSGNLKLLSVRANPLVRTLLGALKGSVNRSQPNVGASCLVNMRTAFQIFPAADWTIVSKASQALQRAINSQSFASPVLKPEAMRAACSLINNICESPASANAAELNSVLTPVFKFILDSVSDKSIKAASTAVTSTSVLVRLAKTFSAQLPDLLKQVFSCLEQALSKADVDLEVKRSAIEASCSLLTSASAELVKVVPDVAIRLVKVTIELSKNDALRSSALPLLALCASKLALSGDAVTQIVNESTALLKKADRQVREGSLRCLNAVLANHGKAVGEAQSAEIVKITSGVQNLLSESELFLAVLCLTMLRSAVANSKAAASALASSSLLNDALTLTKSALSQATQEISELLSGLVRADASLVSPVLKSALTVAESETEARVLPHIAQVLAAIVAADIEFNGGKGGAKGHLDKLVDGAGANKPYAIPLFGELGRNTALEKSSPKALALLQQKMKSGSDEEKTLASTALGRVASSALNVNILNELLGTLKAGSAEESVHYFNLRALREAVSSAVHDQQTAAQQGENSSVAVNKVIVSEADTKIAAPLLELSKTFAVSDESVTIPLVSECLGRAALLLPEKVVPMLIAGLQSAEVKESTALCVASAMRFVVLACPNRPALRALLADKLAGILHNGLSNASHRVRRASLLLLVTSVQLVGACTFDVKNDIELLLKLCNVDKSLQISIDVGLFVHVKDAGLEMRRAAFDALVSLCVPVNLGNTAAAAAKVVPITLTNEGGKVVSCVANALGVLKDEVEPDLQISARAILLKLAEIPSFASEILAQIDKIADALKTTISAKVKDGADADAVKDNSRSAALCALKLAPRAVHSVKLADAVKAIATSPLIAQEKDALIQRSKEE